jgi:hypothetical protein
MLELLFDPLLDVGPPVSDVSTDPEAGWSFTAVAPLVKGPDRHSQISGEFLDGHELFVGCHRLIVCSYPLHRLSIQCQQPFRKPFRRLHRARSEAFPVAPKISSSGRIDRHMALG